MELNIHNHYYGHSKKTENLLKDIKELLIINNKIQEKMSQELDNLVKEVAEQKTVIESAVTFIQGIKERLDEAIGDNAKLAELSADLDMSQNQLAAAIEQNTTPQPAPAPIPATGTGDGTSPTT